eukprot:1149519-Pelagomonas_calceolata.AAC.1
MAAYTPPGPPPSPLCDSPNSRGAPHVSELLGGRGSRWQKSGPAAATPAPAPVVPAAPPAPARPCQHEAGTSTMHALRSREPPAPPPAAQPAALNAADAGMEVGV